MEGAYAGQFITLSVHPWLEPSGARYLVSGCPGNGKTFSAVAHTGDNLFTNDGRWLARLTWPGYRAYVPDGPGRSRALQFRTYVGRASWIPGYTY